MKELDELLKKQKLYFKETLRYTGIKDRISKIKKIRNWIKQNQEYIIETCLKDYNKPVSELYATAINPTLNHIEFTLKHLKKFYQKVDKKTSFIVTSVVN